MSFKGRSLYNEPPKLELPNPDLSSLTKDEFEQLKRVAKKQEEFQNEIEQSIW